MIYVTVIFSLHNPQKIRIPQFSVHSDRVIGTYSRDVQFLSFIKLAKLVPAASLYQVNVSCNTHTLQPEVDPSLDLSGLDSKGEK
jgi:hypothetical protein